VGGVKLMVCVDALICSSRCSCAAAVQLPLPAWLASITKTPADVTERILPAIVPVAVLAASTESTTGFPDPPPVASSGIASPVE